MGNSQNATNRPVMGSVAVHDIKMTFIFITNKWQKDNKSSLTNRADLVFIISYFQGVNYSISLHSLTKLF